MNAKQHLRAAAGFGLLCLLATVTHAGMVSPCEDPTVLSGARVQVFIFPYASDTRLTPQGRALAKFRVRPGRQIAGEQPRDPRPTELSRRQADPMQHDEIGHDSGRTIIEEWR